MTFSATYATPPLSEDYVSAIDSFLPALEMAWSVAMPGFKFDEWQLELVRRMFEVYPLGHPKEGVLRFRQYATSVARQNGKTELVALATLSNLLWREMGGAPGSGDYTVGVASTAEQARLVYSRVQKIVDSNPALARRMKKSTDTRGIVTMKGNRYELRANRPGIIQGIDLACAIVDETHLGNPEVYSSLVAGLGGRDNAIVLSITTAGDESSELLKSLYEQGMESLNDPDTRFGFACWEASSATVPDDDSELLALLREANPSLASGRLDETNLIADVRSMPKPDIIRYRLNRFTSSVESFMDLETWNKCARPFGEVFPVDCRRLVFGIERSNDWGYASIVVTGINPDGIYYTELVRTFKKPTFEGLLDACMKLAKFSPASYVVDSYNLKDLGAELRRRGLPVTIGTHSDLLNASSLFYALTHQQKLRHASDPLMTVQLARTKMKFVGEAWKLARKDSSTEIDAVIATALSLAVCQTSKDRAKLVH